MPIRRSQKKRSAEPRQKQNHRRLVIDPMVNTGNSAHRHQARPKADPTRPHHRMVTLAQSSPGDRSACAPQSKTATVMLGCACVPTTSGMVHGKDRSSCGRGAKRSGISTRRGCSNLSNDIRTGRFPSYSTQRSPLFTFPSFRHSQAISSRKQ